MNIPPKIRFALYLIGALASLGVVYAVDKAWAGDAEVRFVQGLVALINILAAGNTPTGRILGKAFTGGTFSRASEDDRNR